MANARVRTIKKISFVTAHFFDFNWTKNWIDRIRTFTDYDLIREFLIVNQDRNIASQKKLEKLDPKVKVVEYPVNQELFERQGHDHAHVLNLAIGEAQGEFICVLDTDCHPISPQWIQTCETILLEKDAITAVDYYQLKNNSKLLSHPCFMLLQQKVIPNQLDFAEGLFDENIDTGRLIGRQLEQAGCRVYYAVPVKAFRSYWGFIYINSFYHHERGSYSGGDQRLKKQNDWRQNFFKRIVISGKRYDFNKFEYLFYRYYYLNRPNFNSISSNLLELPSKIFRKFLNR